MNIDAGVPLAWPTGVDIKWPRLRPYWHRPSWVQIPPPALAFMFYNLGERRRGFGFLKAVVDTV